MDGSDFDEHDATLPVPAPAPAPPALSAPAPSGSWDLDLAAASLRMDTGDTDSLFEALGAKLTRILGPRAEIQRERGLKRHPKIARIVVDVGGDRLEATRARTGVTWLAVHAVRGITLQTTEITADDWIDRLVRLVGQEAARSSDVRTALGGLLEN